MERFDKKTIEIIKRLQNARLSLLAKQPFYALLLLHLKFALDNTCETAYTDGVRIAFNTDFLDEISDSELEFILMHEALHAALGHPFRKQSDYDLECYDKACDIVVNSNIFYSFNKDIKSITLKKYGVAMHKTPSGKEGYKCTVEEVYDELLKESGKQKKKQKKKSKYGSKSKQDGNNKGDASASDQGEDLNDDNESDDEAACDGGAESDGDANSDGEAESDGDTECDDEEDCDDEEKCDDTLKDEESDDSSEEQTKANSGSKGKKKSESGKLNVGCKGDGKGKKMGTCDSVVSEADLSDLIATLLKGRAVHGKIEPDSDLVDRTDESAEKEAVIDDHSFWNGDEEDNIKRDFWMTRMIEATDIVTQKKGSCARGITPLAAERIVEDFKNPVLDWRTILDEFVQEEICDYSFSPPDRRMDECPFFLPDFNEKDENVKNILFMIDTSGSMGDEDITDCYSEIYGAIQQFNGKLQGKLGFFDAVVVEPIPFEDEDEFKIIRPKGGGGTSFDIIFDYVEKEMDEEPPVSIVILTDGYAPFPEESRANGIPVLWIINNNEVTPPWGKIARIINRE